MKPKTWKPWFIYNSKIPKILSWFAPITITNITLGFVVFSKDVPSEETIRHETIHFQQFLETGFVGFLLVYFWDYLKGLAKYKDGQLAYFSLRAEQEAYRNHHVVDYLETRERWAWLKTDIIMPEKEGDQWILKL